MDPRNTYQQLSQFLPANSTALTRTYQLHRRSPLPPFYPPPLRRSLANKAGISEKTEGQEPPLVAQSLEKMYKDLPP